MPYGGAATYYWFAFIRGRAHIWCGGWALVLIDFDGSAKTVVLRNALDEESVGRIIDRKKTGLFGTPLRRPASEDVHVHSVKFLYECILMVSAKYSADYFRKAVHPIRVDHNVSEVVLGDGVFPIRSRSAIARALSRKRGKNRVDLRLEEHVFVEAEDAMYFDGHGKEVKFPYKTGPDEAENYPARVLRNSGSGVKKCEITIKEALTRLGKRLQRPVESDVRDLNDQFTVGDVLEIYVPVFEARLVGPKKKVAIMRIDAVRKKIL